MPREFNPMSSRKFWLDVWLERMMKLVPPPGHSNKCGFLWVKSNDLVEAFLLGLADHIRPELEKSIAWMESQPEREPRQYSKELGHWRAGWRSLSQWRQMLGFCKWLSRGDTAENHFAGALEAEWYSWTSISPSDAALERDVLEYDMPHCLAVALAAKNPVLGLKLLAFADIKEPFEEHVPMLEFGEWACRHLAGGGERNAEFIARGEEMLRMGPPDFFTDLRRREAALWLKAIYWDSGMARTPEQTIGKAYDFIPGVERPDFVPI